MFTVKERSVLLLAGVTRHVVEAVKWTSDRLVFLSRCRTSLVLHYDRVLWIKPVADAHVRFRHPTPFCVYIPEVSSICSQLKGILGSKDRGCRMWTDCEALWGKSVICDTRLYKCNWFDLTMFSYQCRNSRLQDSSIFICQAVKYAKDLIQRTTGVKFRHTSNCQH